MLILLLCLFAFLAGFIDAMVGGGGLIQLPAFFILFPHLTLIQTLATNKTASFLGTTVSAIQYIRKVALNWKYLLPAIISAFVGGMGGALLVSYIHKEQFMPVIITVLVFVFLYTVFKKQLGMHHIDKSLSVQRHYTYAISTGLILGVYEGLIGPGSGSFLIFAFIVIFGLNFLYASANAKVVNWIASLGALILFLLKAAIVWSIALPVALCNMAGNYAGSHLALKKGSAFIRVFFILVVLSLILKLGYDYYCR
jgi:uncharacterized membrane protein YfcA